MPKFAELVESLFQGWFSIFTGVMGQRVALKLAAAAASLSVTAALITGVGIVAGGLSSVLPGWALMPMSLIVPSNADDCMAVVASVEALVMMADIKERQIMFKGGV